MHGKHIPHERAVAIGSVKHPVFFFCQSDRRHIRVFPITVPGLYGVAILRIDELRKATPLFDRNVCFQFLGRPIGSVLSGRIVPNDFHFTADGRTVHDVLFPGIDPHDRHRAFKALVIEPDRRTLMRLCSGLHSAVQPVACAHIGAAGPVGVQGMDGQYIQSILQQILPNAFIHDIGHRVAPLDHLGFPPLGRRMVEGRIDCIHICPGDLHAVEVGHESVVVVRMENQRLHIGQRVGRKRSPHVQRGTMGNSGLVVSIAVANSSRSGWPVGIIE